MKKKLTSSSRTTARSKITSMALPKPPVNSVAFSDEPNSSGIEEQKLNKKQLHDLLAGCRFRLNAAQEREDRTLANLHQAHASLNEERKKWLESTNHMKMDAKVTIVRASSVMIEALARMIGGDGF